MMNCYVQISNKDYLLQHSSFMGHTTKVIMGLRVKVIYYENREVTHIIKKKKTKLIDRENEIGLLSVENNLCQY